MAYDGRIISRALAGFDEDKQRQSALSLDQRRRALYARESRPGGDRDGNGEA